MHIMPTAGWRAAVSLRARIFGGFAVILALLGVLVAVQLRGTLAVELGATRVGLHVAAASMATDVALAVADAHARVVQYALAPTAANQQAGTASLVRLDAALAGQSQGTDEAALVTAYRRSVDATFEAVQQQRNETERLQAAATDLGTITAAIAKQMAAIAEPDLIRAGLNITLVFHETDAKVTRYLLTHNPAEANAAGLAVQGLRELVASFAGLVDDNRRLKKFTAALAAPLQAYADALTELVAVEDRQRTAAAAREKASDAVMVAAADQRGRELGSLRAAVDGMLHTVSTGRRTSMITAAAALALGVLLAWVIGRGIARLILRLTLAMNDLVEGRLDVPIPHAQRRDELGQMARAVTVFREQAMTVGRLEAEQKTAKQRAEHERHALMSRLEREFQASVQELVDGLKDGIAELRRSADAMIQASGQATAECELVAGAAGQTTANVGPVAYAAEELANSVREIARQVGESAAVAGRAVAQAAESANTIETLAEAGERIGAVVAMINEIAGRTNLLALNATIEAARAGEAGKGFAVVAAEVKALAGQTAKATDRIRQEVTAIHAVTGKTVMAVRDIGGTITRMRDIAAGIAAAVEQQGAATKEIARSIQQAADGAARVSGSTVPLMAAASETSRCVDGVVAITDELRGNSDRLEASIGRFLGAIRAA